MMTMQSREPRPLAPLAKRRAVASRYLFGLALVALSAVLEQTFHLWNGIDKLPDTATLTGALLPLLGLLLPFLLGAVLTVQSTARLQAWGYPVAGRGDLQGLDERQRLEFLEAQAKAQRFYINLAIFVTFWVLVSDAGLEGYSWFFGLQVVGFLTAMFSGLPTALMVQSECEMGDEE